ncbi:septal ring lytic transglycosylase RlpA family protein [Ferrovibrio terrae]|uniref:Endolytic peptidoglycan transglycosylase RlpA n=1 Tax=Ferrovibrio terrae TaxID=2594003 RepID=A0A516H5S6_9PROT|nr:septal ring lytic transglycosylase RlpA family protein [Ferrovibrio terrae]QDO99075.1 septal ring lytic transglycosylase RlpA family protein [Ferrovibrio terrae]
MNRQRHAIPCLNRGGRGDSRTTQQTCAPISRSPALRSLALLAALFGLSACAEAALLNHSAKSVVRSGEPPSQAAIAKGGIYKVGNPYQINGVWYYPKEDPNYDETGIGSWYGEQFHGKATANGEIFDMNEVTAAHPTLPMPSLVRVTNLENGRTIVVRMNDRGPYANGRVIDLSRRSAQLIGYERQGTAKVRVQYIGPAPLAGEPGAQIASRSGTDETPSAAPRGGVQAEALPPPPGMRGRSGDVARSAPSQPSAMEVLAAQNTQNPQATGAPGELITKAELNRQTPQVGPARGGQIYVQVGAFTLHENAHKLAAQMSLLGPSSVSSTFINRQEFFRVRLGPFNQVTQADQALQQAINNGQTNARIVVE